LDGGEDDVGEEVEGLEGLRWFSTSVCGVLRGIAANALHREKFGDIGVDGDNGFLVARTQAPVMHFMIVMGLELAFLFRDRVGFRQLCKLECHLHLPENKLLACHNNSPLVSTLEWPGI
jgi:hypothetical protein